MDTYLQLALICVLIIAIILVNTYHHEDFANVEAKAKQLSQWMNEHPKGNYDQFIQANPESNIVEYTKLRDISASVGHTPYKTATEALRI